MHLVGGNLNFERQGDSLILRYERPIAIRMVGLLLIAFELWLIIIIGGRVQSRGSVDDKFTLIFLLIMMFLSLFFVVPKVTSTAFDLGTRQVLHHFDVAWGCYKRDRSYAFAEIAGLETRESYDRGRVVAYVVDMVTTDGRSIWLCSATSSEWIANLVDSICSATGFRKINPSRRPRWPLW